MRERCAWTGFKTEYFFQDRELNWKSTEMAAKKDCLKCKRNRDRNILAKMPERDPKHYYILPRVIQMYAYSI